MITRRIDPKRRYVEVEIKDEDLGNVVAKSALRPGGQDAHRERFFVGKQAAGAWGALSPRTQILAAIHVPIVSLLRKFICRGALAFCVLVTAVSPKFFEGYGYHGNTFEQSYRCYPVSFIDKDVM
ncbi:hypothetical protein Taro_035191 [Colocasia esculenta]|uniref:Uncharacterized protein n=1 Tax=Colocasia esculenta TaxID=4460 RepID=A0A843WE59_COLES|nr:hypothetical protein [Colocasia esculenta]